MTEQSNLEALYPDIEKFGSLSKLLRAELQRIGSSLTVFGLDEKRGDSASRYWATVKPHNRESSISAAINKRAFTALLWLNGVELAALGTVSTDSLVRVLDAWFIQQLDVTRLNRNFPEVEIYEAAPYYEEGAQAYVSFCWQKINERVCDYLPILFPIVQIAMHIPELNQLLPYTSLDRLCFSRCTGYPFTRDCPYVAPQTENTYGVISPDGELLGNGSAQEIIMTVVSNLPRHCGPAKHGTAEDFQD